MKLKFNRTYDLSPVSIWIYGILLLLIFVNFPRLTKKHLEL